MLTAFGLLVPFKGGIANYIIDMYAFIDPTDKEGTTDHLIAGWLLCGLVRIMICSFQA